MRPVLAAIALAVACAGTAEAARTAPCPGQRGFSCGSLAVPLDRAAPGGEQLRLRYAVQSGAAARRRPLLVALTGGPGQPGVPYATSFALSLDPALSRYRLAVLDQRGTGGSGVLRCPALQRLGAVASLAPDVIGACAGLLGPRRAHFSTRDTVDDLEALRVALGAPSLALMGVSYGTYVAVQYARVHPDTTRALILDSVVGADGVDGFLLDTYARAPRVLREQCASRRCDGITSDPVADVGRLVARLAAAPVAGRVFGSDGRRHATAYAGGDELFNLLLSGDLNPFLQAALPGALAAAARGDDALLLRLRRIADGGRTPTSELSYALNVTTGCEDTRLPYALSTPPARRADALSSSLAALDPGLYAPFDAATVQRTSYAEDCLDWPADVVRAPSTDPLPDVPALLLSGRLDLRTPMENALALAEELPRAQVVRVPGTGHDELDSDITGCAARALSRFVRGRAVGTPCRGRSNAVTVLPRPPRSLDDFVSAPGVGGRRGRALFAVLDTATDARVAVLQRLYAGLPLRGGGLRGGSFAGSDQGTLRLTRYAFLPGLRVTGRLTVDEGDLHGRVRVDGPPGTSGRLRLFADGSAAGRLGGRAVSYGRGRGARAGAARSRGVATRLAVAARQLGCPPWRISSSSAPPPRSTLATWCARSSGARRRG